MAIQLLSESVIAQIAAGEVVERPSSVVKELIENALDADAQTIVVETLDAGQKLIRVSDDGSGIRADEVALAIARHATSKLQTADDLYHIRTLGFRGEALATIVAVSRTSLMTRHRDEAVGTELRLEGGTLISRKAVGAPAGTVISVENLFFNTPARLKFMKAEATEKRHIANLMMNYAIAYPHVRFVHVSEGREVFRSSGSRQLSDVVVNVFGLDAFKQMLEIEGQAPIPDLGALVNVKGFISLPELYRNDRSRIVLFVNGRWVQDAGLAVAIVQAYQNLLAKGRFPQAIVLIDVPPDFVDVNVHPTKAEVRFQNANIVFSALQRVVRERLVQATQSPTSKRLSSSELVTHVPQAGGWQLFDMPSMESARPTQSKRSSANELEDEADVSHIPEGLGRPSQPRTLPPLRVVGQIGATYIVAEGPAGMYLVDQFAAHQRVLYEQYLSQIKQGALEGQEVPSVTLDFSAQEVQAVERHRRELQAFGVVLDIFGAQSYRLRQVPRLLGQVDPASVVAAMVNGLVNLQGRDSLSVLAERLSEWLAVRSGQVLSREEMQGIVRQLERCEHALLSPAGRATLVHLSAEQLAREFSKSQR